MVLTNGRATVISCLSKIFHRSFMLYCYLIYSLCDTASTWFDDVEFEIHLFDDFQREFRNKYWNKDIRTNWVRKVEFGHYDPNNKNSENRNWNGSSQQKKTNQPQAQQLTPNTTSQYPGEPKSNQDTIFQNSNPAYEPRQNTWTNQARDRGNKAQLSQDDPRQMQDQISFLDLKLSMGSKRWSTLR